jgi:hypothetical protein
MGKICKFDRLFLVQFIVIGVLCTTFVNRKHVVRIVSVCPSFITLRPRGTSYDFDEMWLLLTGRKNSFFLKLYSTKAYRHAKCALVTSAYSSSGRTFLIIHV